MKRPTFGYAKARAEAQRLANEAAASHPRYAAIGGCEWGIEPNLYGWAANRFGADARCEVVRPENAP